ncbi:hypothetical protein [Povalibacter sp.]|uniref:COG4315 family predicted lipoprotein n=1 Tax=Povalibacter sp. TaxID=1962978 RepID=UPI002F41D90F
MPPVTPADISLFVENGKFVFRLEVLSLYVYDRDTDGQPTCTAECARQWQPVIASDGSKPLGDWTLIERADKSRQWRYRNRPLYTYIDEKPGQTLGHGRDGVWHLVVP